MRGSGITSQQMKDAKPNAVFVWCGSNTYYPEKLAQSLGRQDLKIVSPYWLRMESIRGREFTEIVVDHAADLTDSQHEAFLEAKHRIQRSNQ